MHEDGKIEDEKERVRSRRGKRLSRMGRIHCYVTVYGETGSLESAGVEPGT